MTIDTKKLKEAAFNAWEFPEAKWAVKNFRAIATPASVWELLARLEKAEAVATEYQGAFKKIELELKNSGAMKDQSC
jgi:hypothetical protein